MQALWQRESHSLFRADISAEGQHTSQGYTLQFGTNVLGHQALIHHLLPLLLSTSRANPSDPPRVLLLSSAGHAAAPKGGVDYKSVVRDEGRDGRGRHELAKWPEYGQAKWGDIALARYLHANYGPGSSRGELLCFSMHPGEQSHIIQLTCRNGCNQPCRASRWRRIRQKIHAVAYGESLFWKELMKASPHTLSRRWCRKPALAYIDAHSSCSKAGWRVYRPISADWPT